MTQVVFHSLADEIADVLRDEPDGLPGDALARRLHRRKADVFDALDSLQFEQVGRGPSSRWHLVSPKSQQDAQGTNAQAQGTVSSLNTGDSLSVASEAAEGFLSRCTEPTGHRNVNAQFVRDGVRLCVICDGPGEVPRLTWDEWCAGEGGEDQRDEFSALYAAVQNRTATPGQRELFRKALGVTENDVRALAAARGD